MFLFLCGCVSNTPEPVDLDAMIATAMVPAVETAVADMINKPSVFVDESELLESQSLQNEELSSLIDQKISASMTSMAGGSNVSASGSIVTSGGVTITPRATIVASDKECNDQFAYISDVTVPDWTEKTPKTEFSKTWYIENTGTCTWNSGYSLVYNSGDDIGTAESFPILNDDSVLKPGESLMVSVRLRAPEERKSVETYWAMKSNSGEVFGASALKNVYLSSRFTVVNEYNFVKNYSSGLCYDDSGSFVCGVPNTTGNRGSVTYDGSPTLESFNTGVAAMVITPPYTTSGKTRIEIGPVKIAVGTWFRVAFCCRQETPGCNVNFRVYAREEGLAEHLIQEGQEWNDGFVSDWNVNLKTLGWHDQELTFIFEVEANGIGGADDALIIQNARLTEYAPIN